MSSQYYGSTLNGDSALNSQLEATSHLHELDPLSLSPKAIIAIDLDDVLSKTNENIAQWHNDTYGTDISMDTFYYYYYWKNPGWGTPAQTHKKVREFYETDWISKVQPLEGARDGIEVLRSLGYRLVIVTARNEQVRDASWEWIQRHFPECFEKIICTGQFAAQQMGNGVDGGRLVTKKLTKAEVCISIGASLLIDDSLENAVTCGKHISSGMDGIPPPVLLFGDYQWNKRISLPEDECDDMVYARRVELANGTIDFLEKDIRQGDEALAHANKARENLVRRVQNWSEVVKYVEPSQGRCERFYIHTLSATVLNTLS